MLDGSTITEALCFQTSCCAGYSQYRPGRLECAPLPFPAGAPESGHYNR